MSTKDPFFHNENIHAWQEITFDDDNNNPAEIEVACPDEYQVVKAGKYHAIRLAIPADVFDEIAIAWGKRRQLQSLQLEPDLQFPQPRDDNHLKLDNDVPLIDGKLAAQQLQAIMDAFEKRGTQINELGDLANELGLILVNMCRNHTILQSEFMSGLQHGLELSTCETFDERMAKFSS